MELREWVIPTAVGIVSFGVGATAGYIFCKRKFVGHVEVTKEQFEDEVESRDVQLAFAFEEFKSEIRKGVQEVILVVRGEDNFEKRTEELNRSFYGQSSNEVEENMVNIFRTDEEDDWDYEEEIKNRNPDRPYIIHRDEYFENDGDYRQTSLTYYEGDNIVTDELDVPIYNPEKIIGKIEFGKGSKDPSICYVRNEYLEADYEVIRDPGYFQTEVLGTDLEDNLNSNDLKHSVQKFRMD